MMETYEYQWKKQEDKWKCVLIRGGQQFALMDGLMSMPLLYAGN